MRLVHFVRAVLIKLPKSMHKETGARLRELREDPNGMSVYAEELDGKGFIGAAKTDNRGQILKPRKKYNQPRYRTNPNYRKLKTLPTEMNT